MRILLGLAGLLGLYFVSRQQTTQAANNPPTSAGLNKLILDNAAPLKSQHAAFIYIAAAKYQVPPRLLDCIIKIESDDGKNASSGSASEVGAMQIIPSALADIKRVHPELAVYRRENLAESLVLAAAYLQDGFKIIRDWEKTAIGYNVGFNSRKIHDFSQPYYQKMKRFFGV